ncbi:hypothetical protein [Duganella sp.]|uniref:hypothetical protein n=1 Tax=Duganella sp. TaxID=1904440 RepID=UPI0031D8877A
MKSRLLTKLMSRRTPLSMAVRGAQPWRSAARPCVPGCAARRWLPRRFAAQQGGVAGRLSSIAMVMRRAQWQAAAARHSHAWTVQAVLRAGAPVVTAAPAQNALRMVERHTRSMQMVTRVLQALPARTQPAPSQAVAASTLAPDAVPATVRRAQTEPHYPRMPMTMARTAASQSSAAPARTESAQHAAAASAQLRNLAPARAAAPFAGTPEPITLPAMELARVTDHVVNQLEHRALSWRERMGGRS